MKKYKNKFLFLALTLSSFFSNSVVFAKGWNPDELAVFNLPDAPIAAIISNFFSWLLALVGLAAMISFIIAGLLYLTASGDETQAGKAKKAMTYSIIGVIVGLSGFVVLQAAVYMLSGSSIF